MTVVIRGKDALLAKFKAMVPAVETNVNKAAQQSADEMVTLAKSFAPVQTGKLRDSIHSEPGQHPGSYVVKAGGPTTTKSGFDYSLAIEFGTAEHTNEGLFKGSQNPGARREPFFFPAYRLMKKKIRSRFSRAINKAIKGQTAAP